MVLVGVNGPLCLAVFNFVFLSLSHIFWCTSMLCFLHSLDTLLLSSTMNHICTMLNGCMSFCCFFPFFYNSHPMTTYWSRKLMIKEFIIFYCFLLVCLVLQINIYTFTQTMHQLWSQYLLYFFYKLFTLPNDVFYVLDIRLLPEEILTSFGQWCYCTFSFLTL